MNRRCALQAIAGMIVPVLACRRKSESSASSRSTSAPAAQPLPAAREGHETIPHPLEPAKKVEWFWKKPEGPGPFPALVLLHGHQPGERNGGKMWVTSPKFPALVQRGIVAVAISQPGYGDSDGPPDYCGPFTTEAVLAVLRELRRRSYIDPARVALEGGSRGAVVAGLVAARDHELAGLVLISGPYDLVKAYAKLRAGLPNLAGIVDNMERETGGASEEALRARSVLSVADRIRTPTLILSGSLDDRTDPMDARALANELKGHGVFAKTVIYPTFGHVLPPAEIMKEEQPFLQTHLERR